VDLSLRHFSCIGGILAGAFLLGLALRSLGGYRRSIALLPKRQQVSMRRRFNLLKGLMLFFLLGYLFVLAEFLSHRHSVSDWAVSVIFFLGAVFVLVSVKTQELLSAHLASVVREIIPVCMFCSAVRVPEGASEVQDSWVDMGRYLGERSGSKVSHGLCPGCAKKHYPDLGD